MSKLSREIRKKIEITITLAIFLIVVIKAFFDTFQPENANSVALKFSIMVGFYVGLYFLFFLIENKIKENKAFVWANRLLISNFLIIALLIFYIPSVESIEKMINFLVLSLSYLFVGLLWLSIIIPFIVLLIFLSYLSFRRE